MAPKVKPKCARCDLPGHDLKFCPEVIGRQTGTSLEDLWKSAPLVDGKSINGKETQTSYTDLLTSVKSKAPPQTQKKGQTKGKVGTAPRAATNGQIDRAVEVLEAAKRGDESYEDVPLTKELCEEVWQTSKIARSKTAEKPATAASSKASITAFVATADAGSLSSSLSKMAVSKGLIKAGPGELMPKKVSPEELRRFEDGEIHFYDTRSHKTIPANVLPFSIRPGFADMGSIDKCSVITNHFLVQLEGDVKLWKYSIGGLDSLTQRTKRRAMIERLIESCDVLKHKKSKFVTNYNDIIISWEDLLLNLNGQLSFEVDTYKRGTIGSQGKGTLTVNFLNNIDLIDLVQHCEGGNPDYQSQDAVTALNMLLAGGRQEVAGDDTFDNGQNRVFWKAGHSSLDEQLGLLAIRSYNYSIRPGMGSPLLSIDIGMSAFYAPMTVFEYIRLLNHDHRRAERHLKGLRVRIMYHRASAQSVEIDSEARRTRTIFAISKGDARHTKFYKGEGNDSHEVCVWEHIKQTYSGVCKHLETQRCVNVGTEEKPTWFLSEHLHVLPGQQYKRKLVGHQTRKMIELAARPPAENRRWIINEGLRAVGLRDAERQAIRPSILQSSGVSIEPKMLVLPMRVAEVPVVLYGGNSSVRPAQGKWTNKGMALRDTRSTQKRTVQFFQSAIRSVAHGDWCETYIKAFSMGLSKLAVHDLEVQGNIKVLSGATVDEMKASMSAHGKVGLFVFVLPVDDEECRGLYAAFKSVADQCLGKLSICLCEHRMLDTLGKDWKQARPLRRPQPGNFGGYMSNIAMKLNLRAGRYNHAVQSKAMNLLKTRGRTDTMIIGVDATHPGPGSSDAAPSIAAVVASMGGDSCIYRGAMRRQPSNVEVVEAMESMVVYLLRMWKLKNRNLPAKILVYRDGVNETQYADVRLSEANAIERAWARAHGGSGTTGKLSLTFVVVTKRHHTRFYPSWKQLATERGPYNCIPGTLVESGITSPYAFDFFLQSHHGLVGTARSAHYTVLQNGMNLSALELQDLTNALCYSYQRSTTSVSYATPAYYADHLAERGRQYLKDFFEESDNGIGVSIDERKRRVKAMWERNGGGNDGNPWHSDLNDTMFWL